MKKNKKHYGKDFMIVAAGQIISLFGNAILRFSLPLYLLRETGSSALFGIVTACALLPMIVLSLLGGVLADRVNKRNIMVGLDFLTAVIITVFYVLAGSIPIILLFIVTLMLLYGISGTYQPAVQAIIPVLVPKERVLAASAIVNQISSLANFIGPIIGGVLYGIFGIASILKVSIVCFTLSAVMELFISAGKEPGNSLKEFGDCLEGQIPFHKQVKKETIFGIVRNDMKESICFLREEKPVFVRVCFVIAGFNLFLSSMLTIGIPVMIVDTLSMSDQMLGITQGLLAVGGIIGGLLTAVFSKRLSPTKAHIFLFLCAVFTCVMGFGMLPQGLNLLKYWILSGTGLAVMVSSTMFSIQMIAVVQTRTPEHLVGKVIACIMTFIMCAQPIGQLIYGVLFEQLSPSVSVIIMGAGVISFVIALYSKGILKDLGEDGYVHYAKDDMEKDSEGY